MASLVRPTFSFYALDGKRVPADTPGAKQVRKKVGKWYGQGIPGHPPKKRFPLSSRKADAERMLAALVRDAERGQLDLPTAAARRKPLRDSLSEFATAAKLGLASRSRGKKRPPADEQVTTVVQRVRDVLAACEFASPADLNSSAPTKVTAFLQSKLGRPQSEGGLSHQSATFYLAAFRRFVWWLSVKAKAPVRADLFDDVPGFDPAGNRVHARREITPAELTAIFDAARQSVRIAGGLTGEERYHLYLTAFGTGFRAKELASLLPEWFDLDGSIPAVVIPGRLAKNKKSTRQPLPPGIVSELRTFLAGRPSGQVVWPGTWRDDPAHVLRIDLKVAGVPYSIETADGKRFADFHALRHSFMSALSAAGGGVREMMELARHSDPRLTLAVYTHTRADTLSASVAKLPTVGADTGNPLAAMSRDGLETLVVVLLASAAAGFGALAPILAPVVERDRVSGSGIGQTGGSAGSPNTPEKPGRERDRATESGIEQKRRNRSKGS